uniref:Photosystem I assembly protein Ycf4 n=1 Tax=Chlamydomonas peterfii TaxID=28462 RepID=A0A0S2IBU3_9CHLO|nr:hypothetical chloroplast RF4 [Chlamydomonas peterfii]
MILNLSTAQPENPKKSPLGLSHLLPQTWRGRTLTPRTYGYAGFQNSASVTSKLGNGGLGLSNKSVVARAQANGQSLNQYSGSQGNLIRRYIIVGERRLSNYWWASVIFLGACGFLYKGIAAYFGTTTPESLFNMTAQLPVLNTENMPNQTDFAAESYIPFFPQGLLMCFYGSLGLLLSFYWIFLIFWNVGGGFNEFNKKDGFVRIFRWGYPGKNRKMDFVYSLKDVEAIRVDIKQSGGAVFDPQRTIYLQLKSGGALNSSLGLQGQNPTALQKLPVNVTPSFEKTNSNVAGKLRSIKTEIPLTGISQPLTLKEIEKQASELANFLQVSLEGL